MSLELDNIVLLSLLIIPIMALGQAQSTFWFEKFELELFGPQVHVPVARKIPPFCKIFDLFLYEISGEFDVHQYQKCVP